MALGDASAALSEVPWYMGRVVHPALVLSVVQYPVHASWDVSSVAALQLYVRSTDMLTAALLWIRLCIAAPKCALGKHHSHSCANACRSRAT